MAQRSGCYPYLIGGLPASDRIGFELACGGLVPAELGVIRCCRTPWCVNAAHLLLGPVRGKNGALLGEENPKAKLTWIKVGEIRDLCAASVLTQAAIAARYRVSQQTVAMIAAGKTWRVGQALVAAPHRNRGERNPSAKLRRGEVEQIRTLCRIGLTRAAVASRFGVSPSAVSKIWLRRTWGD